SSTFEKLCDGFGATDVELTMDVTLKAYQMLARMALHLHAMPPHYDALTTDKDRRNEPDTELLPGAILRLTCAEWWKRKLWLLRCEWRDGRNPSPDLCGMVETQTVAVTLRVER
ncbi:replication endonuclease, partial [Escherichia coli]|uniref:replication endonuclease n=1 Tax=Escherichia coli TaxID=562 RepID=UPI00202BB1F6